MSKTILIVDDTMLNVKMAEMILVKEGFTILSANSGFDCINKLTDHKVDLLLLDIKMPIWDGFQTLENIRGHEEWADLPVIFLTAYSEVDQIRQAVGMGAVDYVKKPFVPADLVERVKKAIGNANDVDIEEQIRSEVLSGETFQDLSAAFDDEEDEFAIFDDFDLG